VAIVISESELNTWQALTNRIMLDANEVQSLRRATDESHRVVRKLENELLEANIHIEQLETELRDLRHPQNCSHPGWRAKRGPYCGICGGFANPPEVTDEVS
jgi:predicted RNase H-like nuclease (RuvC/YqgF family)